MVETGTRVPVRRAGESARAANVPPALQSTMWWLGRSHCFSVLTLNLAIVQLLTVPVIFFLYINQLQWLLPGMIPPFMITVAFGSIGAVFIIISTSSLACCCCCVKGVFTPEARASTAARLGCAAGTITDGDAGPRRYGDGARGGRFHNAASCECRAEHPEHSSTGHATACCVWRLRLIEGRPSGVWWL